MLDHKDIVQMAIDHDQLLAERGASYKDAYLKTSRWIQGHISLIQQLGDAAFPIIMIVNKLHRLENDPTHVDNIDDIVGFGKLAAIEMHKIEKQAAKSPDPTQTVLDFAQRFVK